MAADLDLSVNQVYVAKSRVLKRVKRLLQELTGEKDRGEGELT